MSSIFLNEQYSRVMSQSSNLREAIYSGNYPAVQALLVPGVNINQSSRFQPTPLYLASRFGHIDIVNALLSAGANVNKQNSSGATPLHVASKYGYANVVAALLNAGAEVDKEANDKSTPLLEAIQSGHLEVVNLLLSSGADINKTPRALQFAAYFVGDPEIVTALVTAGVDINQTDFAGKTSLLLAAEKGYLEIVNILLTAGADVNKASQHGESPLAVAAFEGHTDIVNALLTAGADVNKVTITGAFPLFFAAIKGHFDIVKALIEAGADKSRLIDDARAGRFMSKINDLILGIEPVPLPQMPPPANTASLSKCFDPIMADEANISPSMAVFYIQNAAGSTISTGCLDEDSLNTYKTLDSYVVFRCKDTVPVSALQITEDSVHPTKYRRLAFAMNVYVHDAEFQRTQIGKMYVLQPVEPLGRIASLGVVMGGSVVSANHCGPASAGDVLYSIHEVAAAATGGRRSRRKTYKKRVRKHRKTYRRT